MTSVPSAKPYQMKIATMPKPKVQLILSGKRKSGKDYLETVLLEQFPRQIMSYRISGPIKAAFSREFNLDLEELLSASQYKENYRKQMVDWSNEVRLVDPYCFLRMAIVEAAEKLQAQGSNELKPIWLLNDARREPDLQYFNDPKEINLPASTKLISVRIHASDSVRQQRGWVFTEGIDDATTECGLDNHTQWTYCIENNSTKEEMLKQLQPLIDCVKQHLVD